MFLLVSVGAAWPGVFELDFLLISGFVKIEKVTTSAKSCGYLIFEVFLFDFIFFIFITEGSQFDKVTAPSRCSGFGFFQASNLGRYTSYD